jgi:imidazolonepropionase-like amidohydrolase
MRLLHLDHEGVKKLINDMEQECAAIKKNALSMSWYMRGGVTYEDVLNMSTIEREEIKKIIDNNLDVTKKSQMPFF